MLDIAAAVLFFAAYAAFIMTMDRAARGLNNSWTTALWRDAAAAAELVDVHDERSALVGRAGDLRVRFEHHGFGGCSVRIEGNSEITLRRETSATSFEKAREIVLGDEAFDREVYVSGRPEVLHAILDAPTRRLVRDLLEKKVGVGARGTAPLDANVAVLDGDVVASFPAGLTHEAMRAELSYGLIGMLNVARRLQRPASILRRLADNLSAEPQWRVRLEQVALLADSAQHPIVHAALRAACADPSVDVRVRAARALGAEGHATLLEVVTAEDLFDAAAATAIEALGPALAVDRASAILANALRKRFTDTAHACMAVLGKRGGAAGVEQLAKILALEISPLAVSAARALGACGAPAAEEPLLAAIRNDDVVIAVAAADALGRVGTARSVLPLKELANTHGGDLRRAARHAIVEIQSRLGGASPGQISLADGDTGELSLADEDPRGRLSPAPPDAKR